MNRFDPIPIVIALITVVVITLTIIFGVKTDSNKDNKDARNRTPEYTDTVKLELEEKELFLDKNAFITQKDIIINNTGQGRLELYDLKTSCDCFKVDFVSTDDESPEISFEKLKRASVATESSTIIRFSFERQKYDQVLERDQFATFKSNDINNKEVKIPIYSVR